MATKGSCIDFMFLIPPNQPLQWQIQDFHEEGVPTPRGASTYDFAKISQILHEIERIWTPWWGAVPCTPPP